MEVTLEALGISKEDLAERVVQRVVDGLLCVERQASEDGGRYSYSDDSEFALKMKAHVQAKIDETVAAIAERHVLPQVGELIENFAIQRTNEWGEKRGGSMTFVEYLTARADAYLREQVDSDGKSKDEARGNWYGAKTTRIASMIDKHLHHHIQNAMQKAVNDANSAISDGITSAVKMALTEITSKLAVGVKTR